MNTHPQEALAYRDLARQQARVCRQIDLRELSRLENLIVLVDDDAALEVSLQFSLDPRGLSRVDGTVTGRVHLNCHGCAEDLPFSLALSIGCFIAEGEALADKVVSSSSGLPDDVLVVGSTEVSLVDIVEDEVLLALPERLCIEEPCPRAPHLEYPAESSGEAPSEAEVDNPFSVLAGLEIGSKTDQQDV